MIPFLAAVSIASDIDGLRTFAGMPALLADTTSIVIAA